MKTKRASPSWDAPDLNCGECLDMNARQNFLNDADEVHVVLIWEAWIYTADHMNLG